jgi:hypothetical protein
LTKLKSSKDKRRCEKRSCENEWNNENEEEDEEKVEGIKRGALPYVATFSFAPHVIMILQTTTWFSYFIYFY